MLALGTLLVLLGAAAILGEPWHGHQELSDLGLAITVVGFLLFVWGFFTHAPDVR